ncbi:nucleoside diphosphate kinase homolog 5 isoform X4 [Pseudopipra pipra]|uniref:nucleoside diphosphate kinase homolog 5 isoform X4 n=1 Tax=Pseudopipra pipra TaxID=415032 RepID=UPI003139F2B6
MEVLMPEPQIYVEKTLAIIKPDVIHKEEEIEDIILRSGFTIVQKRRLQLSPEQCSNFYADQFGKVFFPNLTAYMSSGPLVAMVLARHCAISHWKELLGPSNSLRARITHPHSDPGASSHWTKSKGLLEPVCEANIAGWAHCPVQKEASRPDDKKVWQDAESFHSPGGNGAVWQTACEGGQLTPGFPAKELGNAYWKKVRKVGLALFCRPDKPR